ncbi:sodium:solute symporter family transporter, partial [Dactylosporangium maewongense]
MVDPASTTAFTLVVAGTSLLAIAARRFRVRDELPTLDDWALAGRQFGAVLTWFLLGGTIYTAYTYAAVPGLVYGIGALGFFALAYTVIVYPLAFVLLPRLWQVAKDNGHTTVADYVRARYDSPLLALAVALTGILATMPYIALQ